MNNNTIIDLNSITHPCFITETRNEATTSDKYKFVSTRRFTEDLSSLGFNLVKFSGPRQGLGMHTLEFTHPNLPQLEGIDMRLLAINSHDGSKAFKIAIAMLRQVCTNGMVAMRADEFARVLHRGYALDKVRAAVDVVTGKFDSVVNTVHTLQNTELSPALTAGFAFEASKLRDVKPYDAREFIAIRREADRSTDLWTVFNRIQESLIRGGYHGQAEEERYDYNTRSLVKTGNIIKGARAREITSIGEKLKINQALWGLVNEYLKKA